jgi:hypothetical protein
MLSHLACELHPSQVLAFPRGNTILLVYEIEIITI